MSKHQTCKNCKRDFVGPDSNINENLCNECEEEIYGAYLKHISNLEQVNLELQKENLKLKEILFVIGEIVCVDFDDTVVGIVDKTLKGFKISEERFKEILGEFE